jgi:hypothetical protein
MRSAAGAGALVLAAGLAGCAGGAPEPRRSSITTPLPSATAASTPSVPGRAVGRPGPPATGSRLPGRSLPVAPPGAYSRADPGELESTDGVDAAMAEVDIRQVRVRDVNGDGRSDWVLVLDRAYPTQSTVASHGRVIEYGIVVDADGDLDADCQLGIHNDTPTTRDFRVWLTNLTTGASTVRVGGPYGVPFDFKHPGEGDRGSEMRFWFLRGAPIWPCNGFSPSAHFYAWAAAFEDGRLASLDYAPDASWLPLR